MDDLLLYLAFGFSMFIFMALFAILILFFVFIIEYVIHIFDKQLTFASTWIFWVPVLVISSPGLFIGFIDFLGVGYYDKLIVRESAFNDNAPPSLRRLMQLSETEGAIEKLSLEELKLIVSQATTSLQSYQAEIDEKVRQIEALERNVSQKENNLESIKSKLSAVTSVNEEELRQILEAAESQDGLISLRKISNDFVSYLLFLVFGTIIGPVIDWGTRGMRRKLWYSEKDDR